MIVGDAVVDYVIVALVLSGVIVVDVMNPGSEFGFFQVRIAVNLFSLGAGLFLIMCYRTAHTLSSSFLSLFAIV